MPNRTSTTRSLRRRHALRLESLETRRLLATFLVNSTADLVDLDPGDGICEASSGGPCTLRAAIQEANALANTTGPEIIAIPAGTYTLTRTGADEQQSVSGDLDITDSLILRGTSAVDTIIDAAGIDRVFDIVRGSVEIHGLTIRGGAIEDEDLPIAGSGGGIRNEDNLTMVDSVVTGNVGNLGAGIANYNGTLRIVRSIISGNGAELTVRGGGIANLANYDPASLDIIESTISGNQATAGGGIYNRAYDGSATTTVTRSTISGNTAQRGAGLANRSLRYYSDSSSAHLTILGSTISGNVASDSAGGVRSEADTNSLAEITVANSTIAANRATSGNGGGIQVVTSPGSATATLISSIVAGNSAGNVGPDLFSSSATATFSLIQDATGHSISTVGNNIVGQDPLLEPLADNGGGTLTHGLEEGSPAIDQGSNTNQLTSDQRGSAFVRIVDDSNLADADDGTDIGAVEVGQVAATLDFGDAPELITVAGLLRQYPTTLASDGARHLVTANGPKLGLVAPDAEPKGVASASADSDDLMGTDDEDGLEATIVTPGQSLNELIISHDGGSSGAFLSVWIDLNIDGDWDDVGEQILTDVAVPAGAATTALAGTLPENATGTTFLRARISSTSGLSVRRQATDGEVADFALTIGTPPPEAADLSLSQTVNNANPTLDEQVTFTIVVRNDGPDRATNVEVAALLEDSLAFVSSTVSQGSYNEQDGIWSVGTVNLGTSQTLTITAIVETSDTVANIVEISSADQQDPDSRPGNGVVSEDDQATIDLGTCLTSDPLHIGLNRVVFSCASPGSFTAFVRGTARGTQTFERYGTTVDIEDAVEMPLAIADSSGIAVAWLEVTEADLDQTIFVQAFELQPGSQKSNTLALDAASPLLQTSLIGKATTNTNPRNPWDTNNDNRISAADALAIINRISQQHASDAELWVGHAGDSLWYFDTNADSRVTAADALLIINQLARSQILSPLAESERDEETIDSIIDEIVLGIDLPLQI
jgi:uncharacterized repeat protein (TIGR01451 family)/CSLREA domain-containing protein